MIDQFFGRPFRVSFVLLMTLLPIAFLTYQVPFSGLIFLMLFGLTMLFVTVKNPTLGLAGVFIELFSNPHGHLISVDFLSLRMVLFVGFFLGYGLFCLQKKTWPHPDRFSFLVLLPLFAAVLIGFLNGMLFQSPFVAFQDGNAYLFLLYAIPILSHKWSASEQRLFLQIFCAGALWNVLLTFGIFYLYSHFPETVLHPWYTFLRDIRLVEITRVYSGLYRIFIQTQFFSIAFGAFFVALLFHLSSRKEKWILSMTLGGIIATLLVSFSRSFWIGSGIAFLFMVLLSCFVHKKIRTWMNVALWSTCSSLLAIVFLLFLFVLPTTRPSVNFTKAFSQRTTQSDVAISSRWNLLRPMTSTIAAHPFLGSGFGKTVTFTTDDPRARALHPDGTWTTYTMEWGWLELWLKMGILGPVGFVVLFIFFFRHFFSNKNPDQIWIGIGSLTGLLFLSVTHFFSPYLNHPIGLGFILFLFIFLPEMSPSITLPVKACSKQVLVSASKITG